MSDQPLTDEEIEALTVIPLPPSTLPVKDHVTVEQLLPRLLVERAEMMETIERLKLHLKEAGAAYSRGYAAAERKAAKAGRGSGARQDIKE